MARVLKGTESNYPGPTRKSEIRLADGGLEYSSDGPIQRSYVGHEGERFETSGYDRVFALLRLQKCFKAWSALAPRVDRMTLRDFEGVRKARADATAEVVDSIWTELEQLRAAEAREVQAAQSENQQLRQQLQSAEAKARAARAESQKLRQQVQSAAAASELQDDNQQLRQQLQSATTASYAGAPSTTVDVRKESWYGHYRHTAFQTIDSTFMQGCAKVVLLGVKAPKEFDRTNEEFPCLLQDLRDAFVEKRAPFYNDDGDEQVSFTSITEMRESLEDLPESLKFLSKGDRQVIVLSCAAPYFKEAREVIRQHNATAAAAGLRMVMTAWATAGDVYSGKATRDQ